MDFARPISVDHCCNQKLKPHCKFWCEKLNHWLKIVMGNNPSSPLRRRLLCKRKFPVNHVHSEEVYVPDGRNLREEHVLRDKTSGFPFGSIVLARMKEGDPFWAAVIVYGCDVGHPPAKPNHYWVFWLGAKQISQVKSNLICAFDIDKLPEKMGKVQTRGVMEAKEELELQLNNSQKINVLSEYLPLSVSMWNKIKDFKVRNATALATSARSNMRTQSPANSCTQKVRDGIMKLSDFCVACDDPRQVVIGSHPIFVGGICKSCLNDVKDTIFDCGVDGAGSYCIICAKSGDLLVCDQPDCLLRTYCMLCIDRLDAPKAIEKALSTDTWLCYLCRTHRLYQPEEGCLIRARVDWRSQLMLLFGADDMCSMPPYSLNDCRRPITVLSLFDGISTGKIALDNLGLLINKYYASEVDEDAIKVSTSHFGHKIICVGPVENLTEEKLAQMDPIDLVIGGSPCNDLSLVNPDRKGLYNVTGTGVLFFDFFRILKTVQLNNKGRHIFWMFENVASMPMEYRAIINRFLHSEPSILDAANFSAQRRPRFFWGNIPGLHSPLPESLAESCNVLQAVLEPGREARVEQLQTITTNSNSLRQGKDNIFPISENGTGVLPRITEIEKLFGFPVGYTNMKDFSRTTCLRLLGKSWSVPVIMHIFRPLKTFFSSIS